MAFVNIFLLFWIMNSVISQNMDSGLINLTLIGGFDSNTVREGELLQLQCTVTGGTVGGFNWERSSGLATDVLMDGVDGISITLDVNSNGQPITTLTLSNVPRSAEGSYQCMFIVNGGGEIASSLDVKIAHLPQPQCFQSHQPSDVNKPTVLCTAEPSSPITTVQWEDLMTGNIISGNTSFSKMEGLYLHSLNSSKIPDGNITRLQCVVTNPAFPGDQKMCNYIRDESATTLMPTAKTTTKIASTEATTKQTGKASTAFATSGKMTSKAAMSSPASITTRQTGTLLPMTSESKTSNVTAPLPQSAAVFGMTEIILIAAIGGLIVLIFLALVIFLLVRCCCTVRKEDRDLGVVYRTDVITETPTSNGYVRDDINSEYFVMDKMDTSNLSKSPSLDELNVFPALSAINKAKKDENLLNISIDSSNLYDSVAIEDD